MKKILLSLILVASFGYVQAQGVGIGVRGGLNYAGVTGDNAPEDNEFRFGAHAGLTFHYDFTEMTGLKLEAIYSNKGYKYEFNRMQSGYEIDEDYNTTINYIDVPLLVNVMAGPLFFEVGPQVSFLVGGKAKHKVKTRDSSGNMVPGIPDIDEEPSIKDNYENVDFGYAAGLGWMSDAGFGVGLRYNGGIKSIIKTTGPDQKVRNNVFQLSLMYRLGMNN